MTTTESTSALAAIWGRLDRIYCISLDDRQDRRKSVKSQFRRAGLEGRVEFFLAQRHPDDSEQGIYESHQTCLKMGLEARARHILVFEDDVMFTAIDPNRLTESIDFFMDQEDQTAFFLGCLVSKSWPTPSPVVRRIRYRCTAHAYIVDAALARRIVDTPWRGIAFDDSLRDWADNHFVLYPAIAFHSNSPTDNTRQVKLDHIRRLFGGMRFIQLANERYHRHRLLFIGAHVLVAVIVLIWILNR